MDEANRPTGESNAQSAIPTGEPQREGTSFRRTRERRRRKVPPAAVKRNYLLHILFYDRAFRWFSVVGILLFGGLGAMWPRIFRTTPEGVFPPVKVSGLDLLKARSLKKTAIAAEATGGSEEAIQAWINVLSNNRGDLEANRGLLRTLAKQKKTELAWLGVAESTSEWLLRLSQSNHQDFELAAQANAAFGQWNWIIRHLGNSNAPRSEVTVPILLAALFEKGMVQQFEEVWRLEGERFGQDSKSKLYAAAWTAGWGPASEHLSALGSLEAATKVPELQEFAYRMLLRIDYLRIDISGYERHFTSLREIGGAKIKQHVRFWNLLRMGGQKSRAIQLATDFGEVPASVDEAELYLNTIASLKLTRIIQSFIKERLPQFSAAPIIWVRAAEALISVEEWDDLRELAVEMRQQDLVNMSLGNLSHFFEGVGEHHLGRRTRAEDAFERFLQKPPDDSQLTFGAAVAMGRLGYPEYSTQLLKTLEGRAGNSVQFWRQMQQAAYESKEADTLIEACRRLYLLQAGDPVIANNYAASLLLRGDRAAEAVQVTLELLNKAPNLPSARINRALALIQVGRVEDARPILDSVKGDQLEPDTNPILNLARFRLNVALGAKREALAAAEAIDQRFLFPKQAEELNSTVAGLKQSN